MNCGSIEQIYVTNRRRETGPSDELDLAICGTSTDDPLLMRVALEYPYVETAPGSQAEAGYPQRRLALVRIPGGKSALIHSVYSLAENQEDSPQFFCRVLVHPALKAREALATWDSPGWAIPDGTCHASLGAGSEAAAGVGPVRLGRTSGLPSPGPINDHAVTTFLQTESAPLNGHSSSLLFPERLRMIPERGGFCRKLLRLVLRGCQLVLDAPRTGRQAAGVQARRHFYIVAEPELTALLVYAATRMLPEAYSAKLTFSTWEPIRGLRQFDHARVIGTCSAAADQDLDEEFYTTFGYALNTFTLKHSPELLSDDPLEIDHWIDRAAKGEWAYFDDMNQFFRQGNLLQKVSLDDTKEAYRLSMLLSSGKAAGKDLLGAMKAPWGPAILDRYRDGLWPQISQALLENSLTDPLLAEAFADLIREHLPEVEQAAATALGEKTPADWKPHWRLLRLALRDDVEKLRETVLRILPPLPFPGDFRLALLEEISSLPLPRLRGPGRFQVLLKNCSVVDLDLLSASKLDREWYVWALCHALVEPATATGATRRVHEADDALIQIFWEQFLLLANETQRRAILGPLFPPTEEGARFLVRSLKNLSWLPPETLLWLLDSLGAFHKDRIPFWTAEDNLGLLLRALPPMGEAAEPIWQRLCSLIDAELIMPGDTGQRTLLLELWAAESQPGLSMPPSIAQTLRDWMLLRELFEKASAVPVDARQQVIEACGRLRLEPCPVLAGYFQEFIVPKATEKEVLEDFTGFFHSFLPDGKNYHDYGARLIAWLGIVDACPPEAGKDRYQSYYLHHHVPAEFRWRLAQDMHAAGKLLDSVHDNLPKPTEIDWLGVPHALLFQLAGARVSGECVSLPSLVWLFPTVLTSIVALVLSSQMLASLVPKQVLFLPTVVMLADGIALQTVGLALGRIRGRQWRWDQLRGVFGPQMRTALALGILCAVVAGAADFLWGASWRLVGPVAIGLFISLACVPLVSLTVPMVLQRAPLTRSLPSGILARASASIAALFVYLILTCALIG